MKKITLNRVIRWLLATEGNTIIRIGTNGGTGWLFANYSVNDFWFDALSVEFEKYLNREIIAMYEDGERPHIKGINDCIALKPALCIVIEGRENGLW